MKNRIIEVSQSVKKVTKLKRRSRKARAARARTNNRRRRRLKAAFHRHSRNWKRKEVVPPQSFSRKAPFFVQPESAGMSGDWYWLNYCNVFKWKDHHLTNGGQAAYSLPGQNLWSTNGSLLPFGNRDDCTGAMKTTAGSCEQLASFEATIEDSYYFNEEEDVAQDEESDDDIVVTEEMMQFLEISMRHKASLNVKKKEAKKQEEKRLDSERDAIEDCRVPSGEAEDEKRRKEMAVLYGDQAPKIHGMETALQLTFNRQVDLYDPPYWPIHPFTIRFESTQS